MLRFMKLLQGRHCVLIGLMALICLPSSLASNYFAYIHGKEPSKAAPEQPRSLFKSKLFRLCALYLRGQRAQERLIALDVDGLSVGRKLDAPPSICRPVLQQMGAATRVEGPEVVPAAAYGDDSP